MSVLESGIEKVIPSYAKNGKVIDSIRKFLIQKLELGVLRF